MLELKFGLTGTIEQERQIVNLNENWIDKRFNFEIDKSELLDLNVVNAVTFNRVKLLTLKLTKFTERQ